MKTFLLLCSLIVCGSLGEILSAKGMQQVGAVSFRPRALLGAVWRMLRNPFLFAGVLALAVSFFSFISLLSYADLSFVVPLTAVSYITNTLGGRFFLKESIARARWLGTLLVAGGVALISLADTLERHAPQWWRMLMALLAPEEIINQARAPLAFWSLFGIRAALLICVIAACVYYGIALIAGLLWFADRRRQRALGLQYTPAVTIFKPVRGTDAQAYDNFASFCRQDYPEFQIVFGVQDASDPVIPVIEKLQREFPACDLALVVSPKEIGFNRKVSNLQNMLSTAKHDVLLIADSDIRVGPDYLRRVVAPLQPTDTGAHVGMVTCLYRGTNATTLGGLLENIGHTSTFGPEVCTARALEGIKFALGSTIALKRTLLEKIGGFPAVADYLADDFLLGNYTAAAGYEVVLSDYVVEHVAGPDSLGAMLRHQLRWGRSTRISRPWGYRGLILTYGTATALLALLAWQFSAFGWWLLAATLSIRALPAFVVGVLGLRDFTLARWFWLVPMRDLITFGVWLASFIGDEVHWRGANFRVLPGGKLAPSGE